MIVPFETGRVPSILFGSGVRARIPEIARSFGRRVLLVTGARSLRLSRHWTPLADALAEAKLAWLPLAVDGEPTPDLVDAAVREHHHAKLDAVIAIGGGSVIDAAKAIAGMLPHGNPVIDHLEGVGRGLPYAGPATPLIAVPTTAGSGSEATKNAVLGVRGPGGFKKSFRHDELVPRWAIVDPDLLATCPREVIAADGMDALIQLLESYVSSRSGSLTDALVESGLAAVRDGLLPWYEGTEDPSAARACMAYAALVSGITLAHAGLGAVHGLTQRVGALFPIPHATTSAMLVAPAFAVNLAALRSRAPRSPALPKMARAHAILTGGSEPASEDALVDLLRSWAARLGTPRLGAYGVTGADIPQIVADSRGGAMRTNPVVLEDEELAAILRESL